MDCLFHKTKTQPPDEYTPLPSSIQIRRRSITYRCCTRWLSGKRRGSPLVQRPGHGGFVDDDLGEGEMWFIIYIIMIINLIQIFLSVASPLFRPVQNRVSYVFDLPMIFATALDTVADVVLFFGEILCDQSSYVHI